MLERKTCRDHGTIDRQNREPSLARFNTLLRRRGEVDRAIRIHQNLLEHRGLGPSQRAMARLELGRDYAASGWLDRAERIFREVLPAGGAFEAAALKQLLPLYEAGREWGKAIHAAKRLMVLQRCRDASGEAALQVATAHYHCELAELALAAGKPAMARRQLLRVVPRVSTFPDPGRPIRFLFALIKESLMVSWRCITTKATSP